MKKIYLIFFIISFLFPNLFSTESTPSTQGSEFYFSFTRALPGRYKDMILLVSAEQNGVLIFTDAEGNPPITKSFNAGTTTIPLAHVDNTISFENAIGGETTTLVTGDLKYCYTIATNSVQKRGYMVKAFEIDGVTPQKVSLYAGLSGGSTMDVANVYPIDVLGNEYYVLSHPGYQKQNFDGPSEALVVATEDNTMIEIFPTCLLDNQVSTDDIYSVINVTLNKGETYQIRALSPWASDNGRNDVTGTLIRTKDDGGSNKCKRIAVFSGTQHGFPGDFEYDQNFPTHLWGTEFLIDAPQDGGVNVNRIVASEACTHVTINGVLVATLNQTEFTEYIDYNSEGCYIQTDKPVGVAMFTHAYQNQTSKGNNDASMTIIAPIEQNLDSIIFTATNNAEANQHKVSIVTPTAYVDSLFLYELNVGLNSWTPISISGWTPIVSKPDYSSIVYAGLSTSTSYKIISKKGGFNAYVYGFGTSTDEYGYSAGSAARSAKSQFYLNDDPTLNSNNLAGLCDDKEVDCYANIGTPYSSIEWDFGDGSPIVTVNNPETKASHTYTSTGSYPIRMVVLKSVSDCYNNSVLKDTASAIITIVDRVESARSETLCKGVSIQSERTNEPVYGGFTPKYLWNTGATTESILLTDDYNTISKKYWVKTYDASCHIYTDTFTISIPAKIDNSLTASHSHVCGDGSTLVSVTATTSGPASSNVWEINENGAGFGVFSPNINSLLHQYNAINSSEFRFTSSGTCETIIKNVTILANTPFTAELVPTSADFIGGTMLPLSGGTVTLEVVTSVPNNYMYNWNPNVSTTSTFTKAITEDQSYQVFVSDLQGKCTSTTNLVELKLGSVTINTVINPTGSANRTIAEGLIETFTYGYKTIIYNRYGQTVSEKENAGWDGLYKGKPADAGVYFYVLEYKLSDGSTKAIKGSVEVIR